MATGIVAKLVQNKICINLGAQPSLSHLRLLRAAANRSGAQPSLSHLRLLRAAANRSASTYKFIKTEKVGSQQNIALITLNRPKDLNALSRALMIEVLDELRELDEDINLRAIILTGNGRAFVAGGDIKEMQSLTYPECIASNFACPWEGVARLKKPIIAAVNGLAFGGGFELAMMCDIIYAAENAKFSQPEIKLGTIPGAGGTQRLTKTIGNSKAMEMVLIGNSITADEAEKLGLVSKVFPAEQLIPETIKLAENIASQSVIAITLAKEAVKVAFETTLAQGILFEKRLFHATFATKDRLEGMTAFIEKRPSRWTNK